jgi:diacylglycerol O-acyltransferase / wax synthase
MTELMADTRHQQGILRLTNLDNDFLHIETTRRPMHWAVLFDLENSGDPISINHLRGRVHERALAYDAFQLGISRGKWRKPLVGRASETELADNVDQVFVGTDSDAAAWVSRLMGCPLTGTRPRWRISLLNQERPKRQRIVVCAHHVLADGIAAAGFGALFADGSPEELRHFERFLTADRFELGPIDKSDAKRAIRSFRRSWHEGSARPRWPRLTSGRREVGYLSVPTVELLRMATQRSASVGEYILACVGVALNACPPDGRGLPRKVRTLVPVTLDPGLHHTGNAVGCAFLNIPGSTSNFDDHLAECRQQMEAIAKHPAIAGQSRLLPWPAQRLASIGTMRLLHPDIIVGVNPGFSSARSVFGNRISRVYPFSTLNYTSMAISVLVLGGVTSFGIVSDPAALPGYLPRLIGCLRNTIADPHQSNATTNRSEPRGGLQTR